MSLRTPKTEAAYAQAKKDGTLRPLVDEPRLADYKYWAVINNRFPHDKLAVINDMVILKRPFKRGEVPTLLEIAEFFGDILPDLDNDYHKIEMNFSNVSSVDDCLHIHLYNLKPEFI